MNKNNRNISLKHLISHLRSHPQAEIRDVFKFLFQSALGCEHMVTDCDRVTAYIQKEFDALPSSYAAFDDVEPLDGNYSRVHLSYLGYGLSAETLGKLFCLSAKQEPSGISTLDELLDAVESMILRGEISFDSEEFRRARESWQAVGYAAIHHSEAFRAAYQPAYRVISADFVPFLPLFAKIDAMLSQGAVRLAIEGGSASGKTTLSNLLSTVYDCAVFHMDDFFLRPEQRTQERMTEIGGNVDRERFLEEVLTPLRQHEAVSYRKFDCTSLSLGQPLIMQPKKLSVTEGVYSMHPTLASDYNLSVFLDISPDLQKARIQKRNSPYMAERHFNEWIPKEEAFFQAMNVKTRCDLIIQIS